MGTPKSTMPDEMLEKRLLLKRKLKDDLETAQPIKNKRIKIQNKHPIFLLDRDAIYGTNRTQLPIRPTPSVDLFDKDDGRELQEAIRLSLQSESTKKVEESERRENELNNFRESRIIELATNQSIAHYVEQCAQSAKKTDYLLFQSFGHDLTHLWNRILSNFGTFRNLNSLIRTCKKFRLLIYIMRDCP